MATTYAAVGQRIKRLDSPPKLTGAEEFTGDLRFPNLLRARIVGSNFAHARITSVDKTAALAVPGVVAVLTNDDLPIPQDEHGNPTGQLLAGGEALHVGQPVALVLATSDAAAADGAELVDVTYEELSVVSVITEAVKPDAPLVSEGGTGAFAEEASMHNADAASAEESHEELPPNVTNSINFNLGDISQGFKEADEVVELHLASQSVHQGYIETQTSMVVPEKSGNLRIYTSTQGAFHVRNKVAKALGLPVSSIDLTPMPVGGGFGGKFGLIEPLVAAAAIAVKQPVLLQYSRTDDLVTGNPAPECGIRIKLGARKDGTITALEGDILYDTGSAPGSPLSIAAILMGGYYKFPNLRITGMEVQTHRPGPGAYRAPGAQQGSFAIESAIDELAAKLGIDPLEFRIRNAAEEGDLRPNGGPWPKIGVKDCLEALQRHPRWQNREESRKQGRGLGIAVGGWPGGIEPAAASCILDSDGKLNIVLGSVDLNGTNTTFAQIAAEELGGAMDSVRVTTASTATAPMVGATGGSKITYTVGPAVAAAARDAVEQIKAIAAKHLEASAEDLELVDGSVRVKGVPGSAVSLQEIAAQSMSASTGNQPVVGRGGSGITQIAPGFAVHLAEVEVDELTGEVQVTNYVAVQDVGFALNPASVEGQIHGGVAQGIGWALYEGISYDQDGQPEAASLMDYALPRAHMIPNIDVVLVENVSADGPYGAKGVGEPPAIPGAGAIANAIKDATGARVTSLPIRAPKVLEAMS